MNQESKMGMFAQGKCNIVKITLLRGTPASSSSRSWELWSYSVKQGFVGMSIIPCTAERTHPTLSDLTQQCGLGESAPSRGSALKAVNRDWNQFKPEAKG